MIHGNIDELIKEAILEKNSSKKEAYRALKSEILLAKTASRKKEIDEIAILRKVINQKEEMILMFESNSRQELANIEKKQLKYLKDLLPPPVSADRIEEYIVTNYPHGYSIKELKNVINNVKNTFVGAEPTLIATIAKNHIS